MGDKTKKIRGDNTVFYFILCVALIVAILGLICYMHNTETRYEEGLIEEGWIVETECVLNETVIRHEVVSVILAQGSPTYFNYYEEARKQEIHLEFRTYLDDMCELCDTRCREESEIKWSGERLEVIRSREIACWMSNCYIPCHSLNFTNNHAVFTWEDVVCIKYKETLVKYDG